MAGRARWCFFSHASTSTCYCTLNMTILITGSSGKTARRLAALLKPSHPILIASRSGEDADGNPAVKFDWTDPVTYANPYSHPKAQGNPIKAIYLVSQPGNTRPLDIMKPFIDTAKAHGVERFVLLSAIREDETTPGTGQVHSYLKELGVEWAVLRPTWFMGRSCFLPTCTNSSYRRELLRATALSDHPG
jgi:festuclavine dehydrogenase